MVHELKTDSAVFQDVMNCVKKFEIRKNDRGFQVGDYLWLRETAYTGAEMAQGEQLIYTGGDVVVKVYHILNGPIYGLVDGWCIMSIGLC